MSMIAAQMGEHIKSKIHSNTQPVFDKLGIAFSVDQVWNDLARINGNELKATFYIKGLDNVIRKDFNAAVAQVIALNSSIKVFKVKFKRPEKEVRFYLEMSE